MSIIKCSIKGCNEKGIQKYDLFCDSPHFMTLILCKNHSEKANKELEKKYLKVNPDGTYKRIMRKANIKTDKMAEEQKNMLKKLKELYEKHNLKRTFYLTKDGVGIYIHPKTNAFLYVGKRRMGIFINASESFSLKYLKECDDELRDKIGYYKIWDNQLDKYAFDETIFESFEEAVEQLISFFSVDHSEEDLKKIKLILLTGVDYADLSIEKLEFHSL